MKASIIQIGNSKGLRIPKPVLEQCGFRGEVELEVHDKELIIKSARHSRYNWEKAFQAMAQNKNDQLIEFAQNQWDEEEWEWK
ncbi:MAG: AbrB/MazE/SpoVT family DNA-binding domain-containing protein [Candidatus Fermentibacteraceae bacterium]|nr:AbrB/MazE/SpoVT family DNA-binding domain-containing protein [Candidatus Fermentibacteraceae bacterium]